MSTTLRWLAVLPAAAVGGAIAQLVIIVVTVFVPGDWVAQLAGSAAMPFGFVMLGARVAPARKAQAAALLAVIWIFATGAVFGIAAFVGYSGYAGALMFASAVLNVIGAIGGVYGTYAASMKAEATVRSTSAA